MGLYKSELAFPLYGVFSGVIFYDGGTVILSERQFEDSYRDSVGFGFRYNTPVGPLCLDLGWKLDRKAGEDTARYHLSFGTF
ncbi:MAG: BamA/TamA family outer membrane protein [Bdellovibrionales bacterium]|nr:BamA/TamA family outer membrane protein [Bdellovibrionales bacterium]